MQFSKVDATCLYVTHTSSFAFFVLLIASTDSSRHPLLGSDSLMTYLDYNFKDYVTCYTDIHKLTSLVSTNSLFPLSFVTPPQTA